MHACMLADTFCCSATLEDEDEEDKEDKEDEQYEEDKKRGVKLPGHGADRALGLINSHYDRSLRAIVDVSMLNTFDLRQTSQLPCIFH